MGERREFYCDLCGRDVPQGASGVQFGSGISFDIKRSAGGWGHSRSLMHTVGEICAECDVEVQQAIEQFNNRVTSLRANQRKSYMDPVTMKPVNVFYNRFDKEKERSRG